MKNKLFFSIILSLIFVNVFFASQLWVNVLDEESATKPEIFNNQLIITTKTGNVYSINPLNGAKFWNFVAGKKPVDLIVNNNMIMVGSNIGEVSAISASGALFWRVNLKTNTVNELYSMTPTDHGIFVATDKGIYFLDKSGNIRATLLNRSGIWGKIATKGDYAIVGNKNELIKINEAGNILWTNNKIKEVAPFKATINNNYAFLSDLNGNIYKISLDSGTIAWQKKMPRWVGTNIIVYQDNVIFADTGGAIHSLDHMDGSQKWKIETGANIFGIAEEGTIGNRKAAFFGTSGSGIVAIDIENGELVWKGVDGSNAKNPKFFQNKIYFSTEEKTEYAFTTDRACAIVSPKERSQVDKRELKVEGKFISSFESGVEFRINDNEWQTATIDSNKWFGFVDPQTQFNPGLNTIYCRPQGEESTQYSSAGIVYDENSQKGNIVYTIDPKEPKVGQNILIKINDAAEGFELEKVRVKVDNKEMEANKNITIKAPDKDKVQIEISKVGYNPIATTINVKTDKIDPILLLVGAMCVLFGAFVVYQKIIKKK